MSNLKKMLLGSIAKFGILLPPVLLVLGSQCGVTPNCAKKLSPGKCQSQGRSLGSIVRGMDFCDAVGSQQTFSKGGLLALVKSNVSLKSFLMRFIHLYLLFLETQSKKQKVKPCGNLGGRQCGSLCGGRRGVRRAQLRDPPTSHLQHNPSPVPASFTHKFFCPPSRFALHGVSQIGFLCSLHVRYCRLHSKTH